ncbi:MAG TPA: glycosyltransferase family 2 protein [Candidatus Limnocylindria bacterium]|nr:glycosyltransferase family 2 protein [Candidatus Limnocylindria bacterium]
MSELELSIVVPCLDEEATVGDVVATGIASLARLGVRGEVVVADNGSADRSREVARAAGARVVDVPTRGYGAALLAGIGAARGTYVLMADADDSYDLGAIDPFVRALRAGNDLVMGDRFAGGIERGAMPALHRYVGNPVLSFVARLFFGGSTSDFHCGMRAFRRDAILALDLRTTGMEFASEMVVKAHLARLRIAEVPTVLRRDRRPRRPHLRTWRDGWRHLRFLLLYSPRWLFLYPGLVLIAIGTLVGARLLLGPFAVGRVSFDVHTFVYAAAAIIVGFQAVTFAVFTKVFAISEGLLPDDPRFGRLFRVVTLETGLAVGFALVVVGLGCGVLALRVWSEAGFGSLADESSTTLRLAIVSATALALGFETVLASFFLSVLGLRRRGATPPA